MMLFYLSQCRKAVANFVAKLCTIPILFPCFDIPKCSFIFQLFLDLPLVEHQDEHVSVFLTLSFPVRDHVVTQEEEQQRFLSEHQ